MWRTEKEFADDSLVIPPTSFCLVDRDPADRPSTEKKGDRTKNESRRRGRGKGQGTKSACPAAHGTTRLPQVYHSPPRCPRHDSLGNSTIPRYQHRAHMYPISTLRPLPSHHRPPNPHLRSIRSHSRPNPARNHPTFLTPPALPPRL